MRDDDGGGCDWRVRARVWVERRGREVLGEQRLDLLEAIGRCGSISAAAREVGASYRHAWVTVQEVNAAAGEPLVSAATGGIRGGGAALTPRGEEAVRLCRALEKELQRHAVEAMPGLLSASAPEEGDGAVRVAAAVSLEDALAAIATDYAQHAGGGRVRFLLGASDELAEQVRAGASVDLFVTACPGQLDLLAADGLLLPETVAPVAGNSLVAIAPADSSAGLRRPADLLGGGVKRVALAAPTCPLGAYTRQYLEGLGLYEAVLRRAVVVDHSRAVASAVRAGQADAGLVYGSAAAGAVAAGCRVVFRARRGEVAVRYAGAVVRRSRRGEAARRFLAYLGSAQAGRRLRQWGVEQAAPGAPANG